MSASSISAAAGASCCSALAATPGAHGDGVDTASTALDRGRRNAEQRNVADRVTFHSAEAASWASTGYHVAINIGSSHAWPGGTDEALGALRETVRPGGRVIFGEGSGSGHPRTRRSKGSVLRSTTSIAWQTWSIEPPRPGSDHSSSPPRAGTSGKPSNPGTPAEWNAGS